MKNVKVEVIARNVQITLSADEWELYENERGCDEAAKALNETLQAEIARRGATRTSVLKEMTKAMDLLSRFGASDTEPRCVLYDILDEVFGRKP
jgi:hypothetical protein